jgi:hypothetical protein
MQVLDAAGPAAPNVTMGVNAQGFGFISGLAPATISYDQNAVDFLNVFGPPDRYHVHHHGHGLQPHVWRWDLRSWRQGQ